MRRLNSRYELFINPDFDLFFKLEEKSSGCGIWWDPKHGVEALRHRTIDKDNLQVVEVRTDYLEKYLRARQLSLVVGHYRHLHLFDPSPENHQGICTGGQGPGERLSSSSARLSS